MKRLLVLTLLIVYFQSCNQKMTDINNDLLRKLEHFKAREKFVVDAQLLYPGISEEALRPILTKKLNLAADDFMSVAFKNPSDKSIKNK